MSLPAERRFAIKVLALVPLLVLLIGVNYRIDPSHVFHAGAYESAVARVLLAGSNVGDYDAGGDRLVERSYIAGMVRPHQIAVMGSSRMMQLTSIEFPGQRLFNHSVFGATVQDEVALYAMLRRRSMAPSVLILGIDPWSFSADVNEGRWHPVWADYVDGARLIGLGGRHLRRPWPSAQLAELVSLRYFQASVAEWWRSPSGHAARIPVPTDAWEGETLIRRADGSLAYGAASRSYPPDVVRAGAIVTARTSPYMDGAYQPLDHELQDVFERFLSLLQRDGVRVILWRSPVHPALYDAFTATEARRGRVAALGEYLTRMATARGMSVAGSFNPSDYALGDADFLDGLHPKERVFAQIIRTAGVNVR